MYNQSPEYLYSHLKFNKIFLKSLSKYIFIGAVGLFYTYCNCINVCWINVDWITNPWFLALIGRMMKRLPFSVLRLGDISQGKCRSWQSYWILEDSAMYKYKLIAIEARRVEDNHKRLHRNAFPKIKKYHIEIKSVCLFV